MANVALSAHRIHADDTSIPVLGPDNKTHKGFMWVYIADDDHVIFRYSSHRNGEAVRSVLTGFQGFLQVDAATLYDRLFGHDKATEVGCWAHARRRFFEAQVTDKQRALIGLGFIKTLYEADRLVMKLPPSQRTLARRNRAGPVLDAFKRWLDDEFKSEFARTYVAKGELKGEIKAKAADVIAFLEARGLEVPADVRERVLASTDLAELDRWIRRAAVVSEARQLFETTTY
jgi:hypothetical protein